jgi:Carboxypeptidase regulatory-like domain
MKNYHRPFLVVVITCAISMMLFISFGEARNIKNPSTTKTGGLNTATRAAGPAKKLVVPAAQQQHEVFYSEATAFAVTPALRDLQPVTPDIATSVKFRNKFEAQEKNPANTRQIRPSLDPSRTEDFVDPTLALSGFARAVAGNIVTNPLQNFDGPDADLLPALFGNRFAPPDTNAAVGPNHVVITTNSMVQVFSKTGVAAGPAVRISQLLVGIPNAADDDGDPIILYDSLANRFYISQFNIRFDAQNRMAMHVAVSTSPDPTGTWFAYEFKCNPGRFTDYPHIGVWPNAYYMASNDFNTAGTAFLGAGFYAMERAKMLSGDPTAKMIGINSATANDGGFLPTNLQGFVPPPPGTPNLFIEWFADEFGPEGDILRPFVLTPDFANPAASTLVQLADIPVAAFDARNPPGRGDIGQPAPGENVDGIADRLMHAMNFRILPGGVQSYVLNWTVNVSGVNPTSAALYQAGVRWMELRRNPGSGAITINQQATYAPGAGSGTGRDLWMASVAQDGEGNIGLAANASQVATPGPALNPTAIYTGRLAGDPPNTTPQGEVDALAAVVRGVQTATASRWGDYSSLFVDPSDECTFWGAFEYVDAPTATFDWDTRIFSFKVNPQCATPARGTLVVNVTNCQSGLPVAGASVTIDGNLFGVTGANGSNSFVLAPGSYSVQVSKAGFATIPPNNVTIIAGQTTTINVCLTGAATIVAAGATIVAEGCAPANGAIDPGETVTVSLCVQNTGTAPTTNLVGTLQATGGVTNPSGPQNYGAVAAGATVCRNFTFTASGTCGGTLTASLQLQDGALNLGTVTYTFTLGALNTTFTQNFDGVVAPALPAGWTATTLQDVANLSDPWATNTTSPDTAPNSAFTNDPSNISDEVLDTPVIAISTSTAQLTFRNNFILEATFDGGVLEIKIGAGAFQDIIAAGGSFVSGGYTGAISTAFGSPIGGRQAWSGNSGGYITTRVNLPAAAAGQNIQLRFRRATDNSVASTGQRIDTISLTDGFVCTSCAGPCAENFDGVTAPALPAGWSATTQITCSGTPSSAPWATSSAGTPAPPADTAPNAAFANDPNCISDERLDSPLYQIISSSAVLSFRQNRNLESGFDGGVLEISSPNINGGAFTDILAAGGTFGIGGYNGTISVNFGSPIAGRMAWTGTSAGFVTTTVNLPAAVNGQNIRLRFRRATDSSVAGQGWRIDTLSIIGSSCGGGAQIAAGNALIINESCPPDNNAIDPGERVTVNLTLQNVGTAATTNLVATLLTGGGVNAPSDPQSYGVLTTSGPGSSANRDFSFTATGSPGGTLTATWQLNDGATPLGTVSRTFTLGNTTPCGIVRLVTNCTLARTSPTNVRATCRVENIGTATANSVTLTSALLGATSGTPLPQSLGNIPAFGSSAAFNVDFTTASTGASTLSLGGTFTGGTFSSTKRVTIPSAPVSKE